MRVTIHQPNYFPYPGLFHKLSLSDVFVILDDVQFQFDITNRNKIITKDGNLVPLSQELTSGDQVEIITSKKQKPKKNWLRFVVNPSSYQQLFVSLCP